MVPGKVEKFHQGNSEICGLVPGLLIGGFRTHNCGLSGEAEMLQGGLDWLLASCASCGPAVTAGFPGTCLPSLPASLMALSPLARDQSVLVLYVGDRQTSERPSMQQRTPTSFTRLSLLEVASTA